MFPYKKLNLIFKDNTDLLVDFALIAIGRNPNNSLLLEIPENLLGERIFPIGDLINNSYRQISIASGQGLRCAMNIIAKLDANKQRKTKW